MLEKYYSEKQIYAATFFGGPVPAGILLYKNFKRIGDDKKAMMTLLLTFLSTIFLFYGLMQLPDEIFDKIPNFLFGSVYTGVVYVIYHKYLAHKINEKIIEPENKVSNWNVTGLTILGFVINLVIIFAISASEPAFPGDCIEYGELKHEIYFDEGYINESDLNAIGQTLSDFGYFTDEYQQAARVEDANGKYLLTLSINKDYWDNAELMSEFDKLKDVLYITIGKEFNLILIDYGLSGKTFKKEI